MSLANISSCTRWRFAIFLEKYQVSMSYLNGPHEKCIFIFLFLPLKGRLEQYVTTIVKACRSLGPLMRLFVALIVVFSCLACSLFGRILPDRFGNYMLSLFTLIQLELKFYPSDGVGFFPGGPNFSKNPDPNL